MFMVRVAIFEVGVRVTVSVVVFMDRIGIGVEVQV